MKPKAIPPTDEGAGARGSAPFDRVWQERLRAPSAPRLIPRLADRQALPLSFAQEKVWLLDQLAPGSPGYNRPLALRLTGNLDETAVRRTLQTIIDRHEVLRTRFTVRDGRPEQVVCLSLTLEKRIIDVTGYEPPERELQARRMATEEALRPFDLACDPMLRATLLRLGSEQHVLLLVFHHIAFDAWSAQVLVSEFTACYQALCIGSPTPLPELPIQYADFAHWQRQRLSGELLERQLAYWKQQLSGCVSVDLPTDRPRPSVRSHQGGCLEILLPESLADSLQALSRRENATLFMVLLAAFQTLLARYTGSEDIAVGSMLAGRSRIETEKLIGLFINLLVLRTHLSGEPSFRDLLGRVRETCRGAYSHPDLPFEKLQEELRLERDLSAPSPFQVMFNFENLPVAAHAIPGLRVEEFKFEMPVAVGDLTLEIVQQSRQLSCSFIYSADRFDRSTIKRMAGHYRTLLEAIVADPDGRIASLPLLTPAERRQILVEWNRTEVEYPRDATIPELFAVQAERTPDAVALTFEEQSLTYRELNRQANQLAHQLGSLGVERETRVGICTERSLEMVAGLLAILKAGGACVPLDPAYPKERLAFMLEDAGIKVLLAQRRLRTALPKRDFTVVGLDEGGDTASRSADKNPPTGVKADDVAYVMYTSGSTGKPKGVEVLHRGIVRLLFGTDFAHWGAGEVFLQASSISFDATLLEIWGALLHGGRCVLFPHRIPELSLLRAVLAREKVTNLWLAPSLFNMVMDTAPEILSPVPRLVVGGEALSVPHICRALSLLPNTELVNGYGPTESTTFACCYRIPRTPSLTSSSIPIGRPIANTNAYVLDHHLQPVPIGVAGELCVGGDGLARGYLNRPEITCQQFIPDPFSGKPGARLYKTGDLCRYLPDGNLEFLGRLDNQVKVRGFRIELGEIESALAEHPAVSAATVVVHVERASEKHLVAYVVPARLTSPPTAKELRDFLRAKLPDYMVPSDFATLEALPLTPNGKIDRRALAARSRPRQTEGRHVAWRDVLEQQLTKIWEEILDVQPIGIDQDFFDLGGHSLLAVRMMDRVEREFCQRLPLTTLFQEATIRHLADCLRTASREEAHSVLIPVQPHGSLTPFFFLHGDWTGGLYCRKLARLLGGNQPFYALAPNGFSDTPLLPTVEAMAEENIRHLIGVQPKGPYLLGGFCSGGVIAYEMARQLEQQGTEVGGVILIDIGVPRYFGWLKALVRGGARLARLDADAEGQLYMQLRGYILRTESAYHRGWGALLSLWSATARRKVLRLAGTPPELLGIPAPPIEDAEQLLRFQRFGRTLMNYRPKPYSGRVVLLRTKSLLDAYPTDRMGGWGKLASQLEVHDLPGDHTTCQTEHVDLVAEHIQRCLSAFRAKAQGRAAYNQS